jgi:hypothetical protein
MMELQLQSWHWESSSSSLPDAKTRAAGNRRRTTKTHRHQKAEQHFRQNLQAGGNNPRRPNGRLPGNISAGLPIHMVGIYIDANYIFWETMKNRMEGEMINAYQKMVDRMQLAGVLRQLQEVHSKKKT